METILTIENFYDNQKLIYDICGNIINKEKFPFVDILSTYLSNIVLSIDVEIKNSTKNSLIIWHEKKNPKLLSKFINNDDAINLINVSMNKITSANYHNIATEIITTIILNNQRKLTDYCKYIFDCVIKKCLNEEHFIKDYIIFLFDFIINTDNHNNIIALNISQHIKLFITEFNNIIETTNPLDTITYFNYIKDIVLYKNLGIIYANIYIILSTNNNLQNIYNIELTENIICNTIINAFNIINNLLINNEHNTDISNTTIDNIHAKSYIILGTLENICTLIWNNFTNTSQENIIKYLEIIYKTPNIHNKVKFKILDLQDIIKHLHTTIVPPIDTSIITLPPTSNTVIYTPKSILQHRQQTILKDITVTPIITNEKQTYNSVKNNKYSKYEKNDIKNNNNNNDNNRNDINSYRKNNKYDRNDDERTDKYNSDRNGLNRNDKYSGPNRDNKIDIDDKYTLIQKNKYNNKQKYNTNDNTKINNKQQISSQQKNRFSILEITE